MPPMNTTEQRQQALQRIIQNAERWQESGDQHTDEEFKELCKDIKELAEVTKAQEEQYSERFGSGQRQ